MIAGLPALIPTMLVLIYRTVDHLLMAYNITPNRYMADVVPTKYSAQAPHSDGTFGAEPASESIVVFHLGARSNHPLGVLAPGFMATVERVKKINEEMAADPVEYGLLGKSNWIKLDDAAGNETMTIYYLRDYDALHRLAHGTTHLESVKWWTRIVKDHPHIAIYHETYIISKGQWENIYINSQPTGMGDTWFPVTREGEDKKDIVTHFVRPTVDARSGVLRSASKRLNLSQLEEREKTDGELYDKTY